MAYNTTERPGTLNLRGRGEYVNTKVRTSDRQISEQAEPRDYDPLRSDIWNLHKSSYNRISDLTHNEFHSTTRDSLDRTVQERARLPLDRSHPLHVVRSFGVTDTALSRQLRQLNTGVLPSHPTNHNQHTMQSTYRETYGRDGRAGVEREPRCQPTQTADKWMQFRRRKSWLFDTDKAPSQFTDDALTCPPIPKEVRACIEAAQDAGDTCRKMDQLEKQVAALQHKLSEAHYPEPVSGPPVPTEPHDPADESPNLLEPSDRAAPATATERQEPPRDGTTPVPELEQTRPTTQHASGEAQRDSSPVQNTVDQSERPEGPQPCSADREDPVGPSVAPAHPLDPVDPTHLADPEYPTARRLTSPCAPPERDLSEVFPEADTTHCPGPAAPAPLPPCPRGPAPCPALPAVPGCRPVPPPPGRYLSTYTAGYGDPEAGLRATAAPRSGRELYRGPAPLPGLVAGTARCRDRLSRAVATDREPEVGPTTAAACEESV
ncbi:WAS/WASL-interacting protein family member 1-like [Amphibalanus amphitrite]|uniref:WAS/WASL-interacting protein family member 1-like n=1 Tax=Amphibalanus amphitrite TaxID=1232801 RepID=UPI001C902D0E|nr:WAS/WASL-interacting protein family member 1-like [Amphibalanus amphitrite]